MRRWLRNFWSGAGSIVAICPAPTPSRYLDLLPKESIEDTLRADWIAVGNDIATAMGRVDQENGWDHPEEKSGSAA